jgi:hypothetical protein
MPGNMQPFNPPPPSCPNDDGFLEELNEFDLFFSPDIPIPPDAPWNQQRDFPN